MALAAWANGFAAAADDCVSGVMSVALVSLQVTAPASKRALLVEGAKNAEASSVTNLHLHYTVSK